MISGKTQIAAAVAVLALSASVSAAPTADAYLKARGPGMSKVVSKVNDAHHAANAVDASNAHIKMTSKGTKQAQELTGHSKKKRDLEDELEELFARGPGMSTGKITSKVSGAHHAANAVDASNASTKMTSKGTKQAQELTGHSKKKRDLEDELEELFARGPGMSKVVSKVNDAHHAANAAHAANVGHKLDDKGKKYAQELTGHSKKKRDLEDELEELFARGLTISKIPKKPTINDVHHAANAVDASNAATKMTGKGTKQAQELTGHSKRKRDLASLIDYIEARGFELDDLE